MTAEQVNFTIPTVQDIVAGVQPAINAAQSAILQAINAGVNVSVKTQVAAFQADFDAYKSAQGTANTQVLTALSTMASSLGADTTAIEQAIANLQTFDTAFKADVDAGIATIEADITAGGGGGGSQAWKQYPATGPDAKYMPYMVPPSDGTTPVELPGGKAIVGNTTISAGSFFGVFDIVNNAIINGAGPEMLGGTPTIIDLGPQAPATVGLRPIYGKAAIVCEASTTMAGAGASNMTVRHVSIAASSGQNGTAICNGGQGYNFTIGPNFECYGCEEGSRSLGGAVTILPGTRHHHCGADTQSTGDTHGSYFSTQNGQPDGTDLSPLTATSATWDHSLLAHELKSRLGMHIMTNCIFAQIVIPGSAGSYTTGPATQLGGNGSCVDISNGGTWNGQGNLYYKGPGCQDKNLITFAVENNVYKGSFTENNGIIVNLTGGTIYIGCGNGTTVTFNNPIIIGPDPVATEGGTLVLNNPTRLPVGSPIPWPSGAPIPNGV